MGQSLSVSISHWIKVCESGGGGAGWKDGARGNVPVFNNILSPR